MATPASAAQTRVAYIAEVTAGTTPSSPAFQVLRATGAGIRTNKSTEAVRELAADENVRDEIQVGQRGSAAYNFALSYGTLDDIIAAALRGTWATNVVVNGVTEQSFTFEETLDLNGSKSYSRLTYAVVDTFALDVSAQKGITGSFALIGQKETLATSILSSATYVAANTKQPMAAGVSVASLSVASLSAPKVNKLTLNIARGVYANEVIDNLYPDSFGRGLCDVTGSLDLYFVANAHYQAVLDHGGGALSFNLGQTTNEKYTFSLPSIVFLDGVRQIGGANGAVMVSIPFRAKYNAGIGGSIQITRAVA